MNVNNGGPHILLFERDQQLVALLSSEFQLAGYQCHAARTAVEVFDAIARYPIRLVLVNLAQAAAGRREFWVALDAQRRGRGVQVFTFRCTNIASYGSDDPDDRSHATLADLDVDGMLGVMNLVDTVRSRIAGATTGSFSRIPAPSASNDQNSGVLPKLTRQSETPESRPAHVLNAQVTIPLPSMQPDAVPHSQGSSPVSSRSQMPPPPSSPASPRPASSPSYPPVARGNGDSGKPVSGSSNVTDRIRAVIYPSERAFSPLPETNRLPHNSQYLAAVQRPGSASDYPAQQQLAQKPAESNTAQALDREIPSQKMMNTSDSNSGQVMTVQNRPSASDEMISLEGQESSLAQLSRMVREHKAAVQNEESATSPRRSIPPTPQLTQPEQEAQNLTGDDANGRSLAQQARPFDDSSLSDLPLRASPIQGIATQDEPEYLVGQAPAQPILQSQQPDMRLGAASIGSFTEPLSSELTSIRQEQAHVNDSHAFAQKTDMKEDQQVRGTSSALREVNRLSDDEAERAIARRIVEQVQVQPPTNPHVTRQQAALDTNATADDMLLNIVQSLPPMSPLPAAPSPSQAPVLSGRATRSLGSVLLEGHLVPQQRLEVAQNIQRMLRGVDMNYSLGEILLMFKLLTPDQLLAASLISYGLISTTQISALGRIRQELHSIGLEYDLESLLVLFRILSPDQLREVRASWTA